MGKQNNGWATREKAFAAFASGPLLDFWRRREEGEFVGVDNVMIRYARFISPQHKNVILLCPGRIESYVKYPELAWDLFHSGYDVVIIDHRGQGRSGRLLTDSHRGHVESFSHYVDDLETLYRKEILNRPYLHRFALAHSMGGAILTLLLARLPGAFEAVALASPMFGILLPMPQWMANRILDWADKRSVFRERYAIGTGKWQPRPFSINQLTHSRERYRRNLRFYADDPGLRVGGPTWHWVRESVLAGKRILSLAKNISTPLLVLQAGTDKVVNNQAQNLFCQMMTAAGQPCEGAQPRVISGARHEILFEKDSMRTEALEAVLAFFARYS
ncbi:lysophospholipase L2 [Erwinia psidii]|uniref:Lysophospholipase L2 n=1 Tax=Erwinia psidii TaxID=69224 RepID=A0A3N6RV18_9GAMM|nr:lysophospholipase L2 [Erwinia psidii]MCX8958981.1 lysophospholipase L2 [Erwinia psidii]MCX8962819.1 lysophospholipase L2 [Erwinia psidii]MCX8966137.1 lysophospholipase L2 [Erwinia psidii]RQM36788.1 lysophospholipase L2 [Erwinia psidii]